ncbi:MAG TPA: hypothetical protein PKV93_01220 [Fervidobacterium sp.]|nr:hypothetical protein [Fervidobacterium sp.]
MPTTSFSLSALPQGLAVYGRTVDNYTFSLTSYGVNTIYIIYDRLETIDNDTWVYRSCYNYYIDSLGMGKFLSLFPYLSVFDISCYRWTGCSVSPAKTLQATPRVFYYEEVKTIKCNGSSFNTQYTGSKSLTYSQWYYLLYESGTVNMSATGPYSGRSYNFLVVKSSNNYKLAELLRYEAGTSNTYPKYRWAVRLYYTNSSGQKVVVDESLLQYTQSRIIPAGLYTLTFPKVGKTLLNIPATTLTQNYCTTQYIEIQWTPPTKVLKALIKIKGVQSVKSLKHRFKIRKPAKVTLSSSIEAHVPISKNIYSRAKWLFSKTGSHLQDSGVYVKKAVTKNIKVSVQLFSNIPTHHEPFVSNFFVDRRELIESQNKFTDTIFIGRLKYIIEGDNAYIGTFYSDQEIVGKHEVILTVPVYGKLPKNVKVYLIPEKQPAPRPYSEEYLKNLGFEGTVMPNEYLEITQWLRRKGMIGDYSVTFHEVFEFKPEELNDLVNVNFKLRYKQGVYVPDYTKVSVYVCYEADYREDYEVFGRHVVIENEEDILRWFGPAELPNELAYATKIYLQETGQPVAVIPVRENEDPISIYEYLNHYQRFNKVVILAPITDYVASNLLAILAVANKQYKLYTFGLAPIDDFNYIYDMASTINTDEVVLFGHRILKYKGTALPGYYLGVLYFAYHKKGLTFNQLNDEVIDIQNLTFDETMQLVNAGAYVFINNSIYNASTLGKTEDMIIEDVLKYGANEIVWQLRRDVMSKFKYASDVSFVEQELRKYLDTLVKNKKISGYELNIDGYKVNVILNLSGRLLYVDMSFAR